VGVELEAMQAIAHALTRLRDPRARWRVLRWTIERFLAAPAAIAADGVVEALADSGLAVDGLHDLFEEPSTKSPRAAPQAVREEPLDSLVRRLATEFQRLALEWQSA
jgi:hypothetical protein